MSALYWMDSFLASGRKTVRTVGRLGRYGGWTAQQELWSYVTDQILVLHLNTMEEQEKMRSLMEQYRDLPMDLADASLVATAETLNQKRIFTLDRDFQVYRFRGVQIFEPIP